MSRKPIIGLFIITFITALFCAAVVLPKKDGEEKSKSPAAVGTDTCLGCHDGADKTLSAAGPHKRLLSLKQAKKGILPGCEACHGGGGDHVGNPPAGIRNFKKAIDFSKSCLACHGSNAKLSAWDSSTHVKNGVLCTECHEIHRKSNEKKPTERHTAQPTATCEKCHADVSAQFKQVSRHPVPEKKMTCADCHNPHAAGAGAGESTSLNQVCSTCHTEKAGPYVFQHAPVAEDCVTCHAPHGSAADKLLAARIPNLCLQCHPGSLNSHPPVPSSVTLRNCLDCHKRIHGSNNNQNLTN